VATPVPITKSTVTPVVPEVGIKLAYVTVSPKAPFEPPCSILTPKPPDITSSPPSIITVTLLVLSGNGEMNGASP